MIPSNNEGYGFFGTVLLQKGRSAAKAEWAQAFKALEQAAPKEATEVHIRDFLDSKYGRWLADKVVTGTPAERHIKDNKKDFLKSFKEVISLSDRGYFE